MSFDSQEIAERLSAIGDGVDVEIPLTAAQTLANFKYHLELFQPIDYEAGCWAYKIIASKLITEAAASPDC